jgi:hypothetical protein
MKKVHEDGEKRVTIFSFKKNVPLNNKDRVLAEAGREAALRPVTVASSARVLSYSHYILGLVKIFIDSCQAHQGRARGAGKIIIRK